MAVVMVLVCAGGRGGGNYHRSLSLVEGLAEGLGKECGHRLVHVAVAPPAALHFLQPLSHVQSAMYLNDPVARLNI